MEQASHNARDAPEKVARNLRNLKNNFPDTLVGVNMPEAAKN